jgi:hypothetical protein
MLIGAVAFLVWGNWRPRVAKVYRVKESATEWAVKCPVMGWIHFPKDGRWTFDGRYDKPTFSPSMNETWGKPGQTYEEFKKDPYPNRNHVFVKAGRIEYLSDCTHSRAGTTVEIEPLTEAEVLLCYGDAAKG